MAIAAVGDYEENVVVAAAAFVVDACGGEIISDFL